WELYAAAKQRLIERLPNEGTAVIDPADAVVSGWTQSSRTNVACAWPLERLPLLSVTGEHNRKNAAVAAAAAEGCGAPAEAIAAGLAQFAGLPHRCQRLDPVEGRQLIDDSKSTTPDATRAALAHCTARVWLLLGGLDKGVDFGPLLG